MQITRPVDLDFWKDLGVEPHPVCPLPTEDELRAMTEDQLVQYLLERQQIVDAMVADPLYHGHEPPIWRVLDALCGFPWMETNEAADWWKDAPMTRRQWSLMVRRRLLRRDEPIKILLLNGGNRGSKSEWAASRVMKVLLWKDGRRAWCFHQDAPMSRQYQQPLLYKYLPPELRTEKGSKKQTTYIAYKQQTGFSDNHFVLSNRSDCDFRSYEQDIKSIQGGELDIIWCDELVPSSWVKELKARVATRTGWVIITFTPVEGYTPTVKMFLDVAKPTVESWAYVLPKDGGAARRDLALAGEDPFAWLRADTAGNAITMAGQPPVPVGRKFDKVARVMVCPPQKGEESARAGVFFFHSFDNPFGNPAELFSLYSGDTPDAQKMRFYGMATKMVAGKFPKFGAVHQVPASAIPTRGTRYMICDPCDGRNMALGWLIVDRAPIGKRYHFYREWPCPGQYVPGVGDMGNWAEPGDKHDGIPGPAQQSLGWGLERYRQEIERLEGRKDWEREVVKPQPVLAGRRGKEDPDLQPDPEPFRRRRRGPEREGEAEDVYLRIMDSRFGNTPTHVKEGLTTLIEQFADLEDLHFVPASGSQANEDGTNWVHLINSLLHYKEEEPLGPLNSPRLFFSEDCKNMIFAMQNWTGEDGKTGACKDFVDLVKYAVLHDCDDYSEEPRAGGRKKTRAADEEAA
jgi:phage terminase large subunit-like protein